MADWIVFGKEMSNLGIDRTQSLNDSLRLIVLSQFYCDSVIQFLRRRNHQ